MPDNVGMQLNLLSGKVEQELIKWNSGMIELLFINILSW